MHLVVITLDLMLTDDTYHLILPEAFICFNRILLPQGLGMQEIFLIFCIAQTFNYFISHIFLIH